jgi:colanic acid/amylovoran biosynthesis protein
MSFLPGEFKENVVPVTDKILQTRARFVLGNGLFTVTGRMHAAISTFQPGKPAVSLAYSAKYKGVIGQNLGREDLIVDADKPGLWNSGEMTHLITEKMDYVLANYERLKKEIAKKVAEQKSILDDNFKSISFVR